MDVSLQSGNEKLEAEIGGNNRHKGWVKAWKMIMKVQKNCLREMGKKADPNKCLNAKLRVLLKIGGENAWVERL